MALSIYHIITDIECRVLHFGKEVCTARPGEDATIMLRKGQHLLQFFSTSNLLDNYSIEHLVLEEDLEGYIKVELLPFQDERIRKEEDAKKKAIEAESLRLQEEKKKQEENRRRAEEAALKQQLQQQIIDARERELLSLNLALNRTVNTIKRQDYSDPVKRDVFFHKDTGKRVDDSPIDWTEMHNYVLKYGFVKQEFIGPPENSIAMRPCHCNTWLCEPMYDKASSFFYGRALVSTPDTGVHFIDTSFNPVITIERDWEATTYALGVAFLFRNNASYDVLPHSRDFSFRIIDIDGKVLFEKSSLDALNDYVDLPSFPFKISFVSDNSREVRITIAKKQIKRPSDSITMTFGPKKNFPHFKPVLFKEDVRKALDEFLSRWPRKYPAK